MLGAHEKIFMNTLNVLNLAYRTCEIDNTEWLWPAEEVGAWNALTKPSSLEFPKRISSYCKEKNLVIQAGGNAGLYPKKYSEFFNTVITIEPDYRNFLCLVHNVPEENVFKFQACVGNESKFLDLGYRGGKIPKNRGKMRVQGSGIIPQITIDSLNMKPDLIHLDIEGYEGFAIQGAERTLREHNPVVVLETNGVGDEYGWPKEKIDSLLLSFGYRVKENWGDDTLYIKE